MLSQQTVALILATLAATVTSTRQSQPDFRITLTNTTLRVTTEYNASVDEATIVAGATGTFDHAKLECVREICIPEYHCILHDKKNSSQTVDLGPGDTGIACAIEVGLITCGWELPNYGNKCRAKPSDMAEPRTGLVGFFNRMGW